MSASAKRRFSTGFTVVELCFVCSIVMLIVMLVLPALQGARMSSRAADCRNNLKQLGLALHNYHDVHLTFSPGWVTAFQDAESHRGFGWQTFILPYIDQTPLYNKLNFRDELPGSQGLDGLLKLPLAAFQCPAATSGDTNPFRDGYGRSCYTGNYGSISPPRWVDGRVEAYWPGAVPTAKQRSISSRSRFSRSSRPASQRSRSSARNYGRVTGLFSWNSSVRIRDITDGTSNTVMVGERGRASGWSIWAGVGSNRFESDAVADASHRSMLNNSLTGFSSSHPGGVYFCLADGSVRFADDSINSKSDGTGVLQGIADKSDGEVTPPNAFQDGPNHR